MPSCPLVGEQASTTVFTVSASRRSVCLLQADAFICYKGVVTLQSITLSHYIMGYYIMGYYFIHNCYTQLT